MSMREIINNDFNSNCYVLSIIILYNSYSLVLNFYAPMLIIYKKKKKIKETLGW